MKVAIVIADGVRQVMFTAENDMEKTALTMLGKPDQEITVDMKTGTFFDSRPPSAHGYTVAQSQGGYLRAYTAESGQALMLVIRDKEPEPPAEPQPCPA